MKKLIFICIILIIPATMMAQYTPKGKTTKAQLLLDKGELDNAKAEIDMAFDIDSKGKVTSSGKNWYLRGKIYKAIYLDSGDYEGIDPNALAKAVESFNKTLEMEKESSTYNLFSTQELQNLYNSIINRGVEAFNVDDFKAANTQFKEALKVMPGDTTALLYSGYTAQQYGDIDGALEDYEALIATGNANIDAYRTVIFLYRQEKKDLEKVLELSEVAINRFPDNKEFKQEKITALIMLERVDEAKDELTDAIAKTPNDPILYYELGYLYDFQEDYDNALAQYGKALEVEPNHYESNYNIGVIYVGLGNKVIKELNEMSLDEYRKKEEEYLETANKNFHQAIPYLEKAAELKPNEDIALLETLDGVYIRLKMTEKAEELDKRIKALTGQ